jgi:hypothetical protein
MADAMTKIEFGQGATKTTVVKYARCFREQLLELPHRHEEDNVHDL